MGDIRLEQLCKVVEEAIVAVSARQELSSPIDPDSRMGAPAEWDSLTFVSVFNAVSQAFDVELEDDDAIHLTSIRSMHALLLEIG